MPRFLTQILWLSSLVVLLAGCSPLPYENSKAKPATKNCPVFTKPEQLLVRYRTDVSIGKSQLGGMLIIKNVDDKIRTVFTSEAGLSFFDFEFGSAGFRIHYITPKLNRKAVIRQLKSDLSLLLMQDIPFREMNSSENSDTTIYVARNGKQTAAYHTGKECNRLYKIENWHKSRLKAVIHTSDHLNGMPDSAFINHLNFPFTISLKQIEN